MCVIREGFRKQQVPESALEVMISSISENTRSQYTSSLKLWWVFCQEHNIDCYNFHTSSLLKFLSDCFQNGSSYGTLNNHRSAISLISINNISEDLRLRRFFKGVFRIKPSFPRYNYIWDPSTVLDYLENNDNDSITLEQLSKKLVMLLALSTGQRTQTLSLIKISNTKYFDDRIVITITSLIKTSAIGKAQPVLNLPYFRPRPGICPASTLVKYISVTSQIRPSLEDNIILTYKKPHKPASSQTIGRWIKQTLTDSGIDTSVFKPHSTRHASTSAASRSGLNIDVIRKTAGWSAQSAIFANFYNRPIVNDGTLIDSLS